MILIFDIFGVAWREGALNQPLLALAAAHKAQGHKVYFASNASTAEKADLWPRLQPFAHDMYCSGELQVAKPSPVFYYKVMEAVGAMGDRILFFDDSAANVEAAQACGWQAFLYTDVASTAQRITESMSN